MLGAFERRIVAQESRRGRGCPLVERLVAEQVGDAEGLHAALPLAEQIAHSANAKILTSNLETVLGAREDAQTVGHFRAHVAEQDAVRLFGAAPDAAAQLMEL